MWSAGREQTRTSAWRLTLIFTLIVLLVNASVLGMVYWLTLAERQQQLEQSVRVAAQTYSELAGSGALEGDALQDLVAERARRAANMILVLATPNTTVGNLSQLPSGIPGFPLTGRFPVAVSDLQGETSISMAVGTVLVLPSGSLMVGLFDDNQQQDQRDFILASLAALLVSLLMTVVAGFLFNRRIAGRVRRLSERLSQIKAGEQLTRLPVRESGDEYDAISLQVNGMLDEIDELLQSIASVTDNVAHDLRTPLARIRFRLEEAAEDELQNAPRMADVVADLDQVLETFEAMLELSRLEKGAAAGELVTCELPQIAGDVVELLLPVAESAGQTLNFHASDTSQVKGEPSLLFRAIYNLIDNAIKHAGAGASIRVDVHSRCVVVRDNGPGIPDADRERVFRRLYRLDQSRHTEGTGLGLSIVRAVAHRHGAQVSLGDAGPGLIVTMEFPGQ